MRVDFHSHILPKMDDGASSVSESLTMLRMLDESGVDVVVLTPHFYRQKEGIESFLKRREAAFQVLSEAAQKLPHCPRLLLGAEVYFYPSISADPDFGSLCMEGTDYILLELPFEKFHENFYGSYSAFMNRCDKKIILAHIERYLDFGNTAEDFRRLLDCGDTLCQMNCGSIAKVGFFERKKLFGLIEEGIVSILGTDAHSVEHRPPLFDKAESAVIKRCGQRAFDRIRANSEMLLDNCESAEIVNIWNN